MKRPLLVATAALGLWACGQSAGGTTIDRDTLTRRQKDSIIAEMPIPGAGAVGRALDAADHAGARAEAHDTVR